MKYRISLITMLVGMMLLLSPAQAYAQGAFEGLIGPGMSRVFDRYKTEQEYIDIANANKGKYSYGYKMLGIANVDNHLNVREKPSTDAKLVGKMSNNNGCEILGIEGEWAHIKSGEVEGYAHLDYLLTGGKATIRAAKVVSRMAKATEGGLRVRSNPSTDSEILTTMGEGEKLEVISILDGWIEVDLDAETAYISADYAVVEEELDTAVTMTELLYGEGVTNVRVDLCQYAKEFVGNRYVWGGTSLTNGVDCSGFTMQIYKKYGISLPHYSVSQSKMGKAVSLSQAKPGDLVFYAKGGTVNHVGIYIGNGQVCHASNPKQGIKISPVGYRTIHSIRTFNLD